MAEQQQELFSTVDRTGTNSLKWARYPPGTIPMWVADMDLAVPSAISEAVQQRAKHPVFGYTVFPFSLKRAICDWAQRRHNWHVEPQWLSFAPGVVPAFNVAIHALTQPGDKVAVLVPLYYPMCWAVSENGRRLLRSPLIERQVPSGNVGETMLSYEIDFVDLEKKLADPKCRLLLLSSPHNPTGRVWRRQELEALAALCAKYNITVVSDEIHWDLVLPHTDHAHIPFASLSRDAAMRTLTCTAPSKTFNISGLGFSYLVAENPTILAKWNAMASQVGIFPGPPFGMVATEAAYTQCAPWVDQLRQHIQGNFDVVCAALRAAGLWDLVRPARSEAMFLMWLDCRQLVASRQLKALCDRRDMTVTDPDHNEGYLAGWLAEAARVGMSDGCEFGVQGEGFLRMNLGCARETVVEAMRCIVEALTKPVAPK
ncbi:Cystathionine beta-lyase [Paratrimastix pyriformis]|uniref:cysteine-S-conjugate beta-lyase n=1 Tax=Paratrimastix pyriformis TaxID=342808 RepID=A0ABQ8UGI6_9EUKA|nr:Cystathionine beta-lyase [Paratrimastix pyriformis]